MTQAKREKIEALTKRILEDSYEAMKGKVSKALNSGAIDIESWDERNNPMILPKCIVIAILQDEATQYEAKGTSFERDVKKEVKNIRCFI